MAMRRQSRPLAMFIDKNSVGRICINYVLNYCNILVDIPRVAAGIVDDFFVRIK
jgi:hypothetical protein